jgi:4-diphosphocytidyl-2-C-methyl-D-erythritol kinase
MKNSSRRVRVRALAKLNLGLKVLHRRPDGYHELRTIYQTISLADIIDIEFTPARETLVQVVSDVDIPDNLMLHAAHQVLHVAQVTGNVRFHLKKRIPMGAGLAGGSSDAAAVLLVLPVLAGRAVPYERLLEIAAGLGSDVPFFLLGGTAVGVGRGEEVYPLPDQPAVRGLVVVPRLRVSTAEAYRMLDRGLTSSAQGNMINSFQSLAWGWGLERAAGVIPAMENDFEQAIFQKHPELKFIQKRLEKLGAAPAMMTGSGSAVFGLFRTPAALERARLSFREETVFPIRLVSRACYRSLWWRWLAPHIKQKIWPPISRSAGRVSIV